jgi:hypothetical protein
MKREELFEIEEPRRGGLARLRQRLDRPARGPGWALVLGAATLALLLLLVAREREKASALVAEARAHGGVSSIELGLAKRSSEPVTLEPSSTMAMIEVKTTDPKVAFYWVSSISWPSAPSPDWEH